MLFGFNLNHLLVFPFQNEEARKHFLIGCLVYLAGFVIPILPWIVAAGYSAILIRQVLNGEKPHLVPWENWENLLKDGAMLFGIRLVYSLPLFLLMLPLFLLAFGSPFLPFLSQNMESGEFTLLSMVFTFGLMLTSLLMFPLSMVLGLIIPAAEIYTIDKADFSAGFRVREWWAIFKKNWGGFVLAMAIWYGVMMVMGVVMQFMMLTFVLICLLPFFISALSMYTSVIQYTAFAQAYQDGKGGQPQLARPGEA